MSATLNLTVHGSPKAQGASVLGVARPIAGAGEQRFVVQIGSPKEVALEPGRWMIEVALPSGERLRALADLAAGGAAEVTLEAGRSSHEWLSFLELVAPRWSGPEQSVERDLRGPVPPETYAFDRWEALCQEVRRAAIQGHPLQVDRAWRLPPAQHDGRHFLFEARPGASGWPTAAGAVGAVAGVVVRGAGRVAVLPVPRNWRGEDGIRRSTSVVVDAATGGVSAAIEDPRYALLLGYLASGRSDLAAEALGELPRDLLEAKLENPCAAAAGAYILIDQLHDATRRPVWRPWIENLRNWFQDLPDGAVLAGRACLHEGDRDGACAAFIEATERGIPVFAAGVRMLAEGFLALREDDAAHWGKFHRAKDDARRWSGWLDRRAAFAALEPGISVETDEHTSPAIALEIP